MKGSTAFVSAEAAVEAIGDGATIAVGGTGGTVEPDAVLDSLESRYLTTGHPRELDIISPMCPGERPGEGGLNCVAHDGMLRRIVSASFVPGRHPRLLKMITSGECEAYTASMGALVQLMTAAGSDKPGVFTRAGLGSFLDPRLGGGSMNARSSHPPCRVVEVDEREYIYYPAPKVDVAIIRGSIADEDGYISCEEESNILAVADIAMAAHASGGIVIAQVDRVVKRGTLDPQLVRIPAALIDVVVIAPRSEAPVSPGLAPLSGREPSMSGRERGVDDNVQLVTATASRMILRRAALELREGDVLNLGAGVPTHLPRVLYEAGVLKRVTVTNEHGVFGGLLGTAFGGTFVPSINPLAIMDSTFQFNFYDGGGLDTAFLGMGEVDPVGNVNVSRFGPVINGSGGFTNITEGASRVVFCGTLTAGGLQVEQDGDRLKITREGKHRKFVRTVEQVTFNGPRAIERGQQVLYVTERAVFDLTPDGLRLAEVAPGIDAERDVIASMGFTPIVAAPPRTFPATVLGRGALVKEPSP